VGNDIGEPLIRMHSISFSGLTNQVGEKVMKRIVFYIFVLAMVTVSWILFAQQQRAQTRTALAQTAESIK
jgi:hypothetical protein